MSPGRLWFRWQRFRSGKRPSQLGRTHSPMRTQTVQRYLDDAGDESSRVGKAALSRLAIGIGADLGVIGASWPEYMTLVADLASPQRDLDQSPHDGVRALGGLVIGYAKVSEIYLESHKRPKDLVPAFAVAVGERLAELDLAGAREACRAASNAPAGAVDAVRLAVGAFDASLIARAQELFVLAQREDEAVAMVLLTGPISHSDLERLLYDSDLEPRDRATKLAEALEGCFADGYITSDPDRIRDLYQQPLPDGLIALTREGRRHIASVRRSRVSKV